MNSIETIIANYTTKYISFIKEMANASMSSHLSGKSGGFPTFVSENHLFYEQTFFDELIENSIWRFLVNGIIRDLFSDDYCKKENIVIEWPFMHPQLTTSFVENIEKTYPIEFVITKEGKRIAYRYTNCYFLEEGYKKIFEDKQLDKLMIIDFSSPNQSVFLHTIMVPTNYKEKVFSVTFESFFTEYFSSEEYLIYIKNIREVVEESNNYVGLKTIPNLTHQYLPFFIDKEIELVRTFSYLDATYIVNKKILGQAKKWYGNGVFPDADKKLFNQNFISNKRYLAMFGSEDFAHSFISSEYLYYSLKDNNYFDYTAVVCGYLKSIEQLLYKLIQLSVSDNHEETLWIKKNYKYFDGDSCEFRKEPIKKKYWQVKFTQNNNDYFDTSFAAMVYLLNSHKKGWCISETAVDIVSAVLLSYCDACRNEHFHKDNINDINEVDTIRNNTFMLFYYILGGFRFTNNDDLGIIDDSYGKMYREIMRFGGGNYYFLEFDSGEKCLAALPMNQNYPIYDENGKMINGDLRFVLLNRDSLGDWKKDDWKEIEKELSIEKTIVLTTQNMPKSITYIDKITAENEKIDWTIEKSQTFK